MTADAVGGVWQYATDLATALVPHGIEAVTAVVGPAPTAAQRADLAEEVSLIETGLPLDWLCDDPAPVLAAGDAIAALARDVGADLVLLNMPTLGARARYDVPVVAVEHGSIANWWDAAHGSPLPAGFRWQHTLTRQALNRVDAVVAPTAAHARSVALAYDLAGAPIAIHNGRRPFALPNAPRANGAFTAGRLWDQVKRTALLDAVAARIAAPFHAAGPLVGPHGQAETPRHLVCLGSLAEAALARELAGRPVFVSAATFEPFGLAVLEAAQAGCPLVLADTTTFRELWDGVATFVAGDNPSDFAEAIDALLGEPARHAAQGRLAQERARRYTPEATAAAMAALFARLAPAARAAA